MKNLTYDEISDINNLIIPAKASCSNADPQMAGSSYSEYVSEAIQEYKKPFCSFDDQLQLLVDRGLEVDDRDFALSCLRHVNYYHLEAYWYSYYKSEKKEHEFEAGTNFSDIWRHYCFDRELRFLFFRAIEKIELSFRTQCAYVLSQRYYSDGKYTIGFDALLDSSSEIARGRKTLNDKIEQELLQSNEDFYRSFKSKYGQVMPPPWILVEMLSLGLLSKCYARTNDVCFRREISRTYDLQPDVLSNWIYQVVLVRNICAHHGRLWNRIIPTTIKQPLSRVHHRSPDFYRLSEENDGKYNGKRLYNTILIIDDMISFIVPENRWRYMAKDLILKYCIDVQRMGFPPDWQERALWLEVN